MGVPFNADFTVPAAPDVVLGAFADVRRMAALMPGAAVEGQDEDGAWRGGMLVVFGPKKIRFNGKLTMELDSAARSGLLVGRGSADARSARVESRIRFQVDPDDAGARVTIAADTTMTGVLAEFARTGGPIVARALLEQFSERLRAEFAVPTKAEAAPPAPSAEHAVATDALPASTPGPANNNALRAGTLLRIILRQWWQRLTGRGTRQ